ncbi:MAG: sensor histidine kinase [Ardenticatenaceae bacterium]
MTGNFYLDWAMMALSLVNVVLLLWLGLTVFLNAEQRGWAIWLASGGLMLGAAFFVSHSAILGRDAVSFDTGFRFWFRAGLFPLIILPFGWYLVILWYAGFWNEGDSRLRRRQGVWFLLAVLGLLLGGISFAIVANPFLLFFPGLLPFRSDIFKIAIGDIPLLALGYPLYILLCITLALDALRHPVPSGRVMGDLARSRARPWLMGASFVLLLVGFLVGWAIVRIVPEARQDPYLYYFSHELILSIARFDLAISSLLALSTILLGQAMVSYEVFTGKTLPRRGFRRYWYNAVILAAGYGVVVGWTLALDLRLVYSLLLSTMLMTVFYALLNWRSYAERERYIEHLRPFVASERLYEQLLPHSQVASSQQPAAEVPGGSGMPGEELRISAGSAASDLGFRNKGIKNAGEGLLRFRNPQSIRCRAAIRNSSRSSPFRALCKDVLGARLAYLVATGPLAPLVNSPLVYPESDKPPLLPWLSEIIERFRSPQSKSVLKGGFALPLNPTAYDGVLWAVPLWSERGLIGVLFLGEKRDGGLYTQEEIEIARASGERLIDTEATTQMARRLMELQRQRLTESQVLDQQTRRVLHDEVLPTLHTAMLTLSIANAAAPREELRIANCEFAQRAPDGRNPKSEIRNPKFPPPPQSPPILPHASERGGKLDSGEGEEEASDPIAEVMSVLTDVHHQLSDLLRELPTSRAPKVAHKGLIAALQELVEDDYSRAFDGITWQIDPQAKPASDTIPPLTAEVIFYAAREVIRNAARYGRGGQKKRPLHLRIEVTWHNGLQLLIEDDGVGVETSAGLLRQGLPARRLAQEPLVEAQEPNTSPADPLSPAGSGQGLALHSTMMAVIGGALVTESVPERYTRIILTLPQGSW